MRRLPPWSPQKSPRPKPAVFEDPLPIWPQHRHALVSPPRGGGSSFREDAYWHPLHEGYDEWCRAEQATAREMASLKLQAQVRSVKARVQFSRERQAALWLQRMHRGQSSRSSGERRLKHARSSTHPRVSSPGHTPCGLTRSLRRRPAAAFRHTARAARDALRRRSAAKAAVALSEQRGPLPGHLHVSVADSRAQLTCLSVLLYQCVVAKRFLDGAKLCGCAP